MEGTIKTLLLQNLYYSNCNKSNNSSQVIPYTVRLNPGYYKIELWGGSGGGMEGSVGKGGYARANVHLDEVTTYYLFVGGEGETSYDKDVIALGGCNGGGNGYQGPGENGTRANGGGGGATDIRTGLNITTRFLVASGGGGGYASLAGGDGGAEVGFDGQPWSPGNITNGFGGNQTHGGQGGSYENLHKYAENGGLGYGSNAVGYQWSSGGGGSGYYGGGGAYECGGGGGSGFIKDGLDGVLKSGKNSFPSPTNRGYEEGHIGPGYARITLIVPGLFPSCKNSYHLPISLFAIYLGTMK